MDVKTQKSILEIASPELAAVPDPSIRDSLTKGFEAAHHALSVIENCFYTVTAQRGEVDLRRTFFRSWNMTNNSAMCVSGQANRLSTLTHKASDDEARRLLHTIAALNRITDEDLAVGSGVLHAELFYRMATYFSEGDEWMSHRFMCPQAGDFKAWRDRESLHHPDLMRGLVITLVHEIYTHSEVEFILPLFRDWAERCFELQGPDLSRKLAWISVHCQGTELRHFGHALDAVHQFLPFSDRSLDGLGLEATVKDYLTRKAACMDAIAAHYQHQSV
jgi:hypothetical protein